MEKKVKAIVKRVKLEQYSAEWWADVVYTRNDKEGEHHVAVQTNTEYFSSALIGLPKLIEDEIKEQGVDEVLIMSTYRMN